METKNNHLHGNESLWKLITKFLWQPEFIHF